MKVNRLLLAFAVTILALPFPGLAQPAHTDAPSTLKLSGFVQYGSDPVHAMVVVVAADPKELPRYFNLAAGEKEDGLEIRAIDSDHGKVEASFKGKPMALSLEQNGFQKPVTTTHAQVQLTGLHAKPPETALAFTLPSAPVEEVLEEYASLTGRTVLKATGGPYALPPRALMSIDTHGKIAANKAVEAIEQALADVGVAVRGLDEKFVVVSPADQINGAMDVIGDVAKIKMRGPQTNRTPRFEYNFISTPIGQVLDDYADLWHCHILRATHGPATVSPQTLLSIRTATKLTATEAIEGLESLLRLNGLTTMPLTRKVAYALPTAMASSVTPPEGGVSAVRKRFPQLENSTVEPFQFRGMTMRQIVDLYAKILRRTISNPDDQIYKSQTEFRWRTTESLPAAEALYTLDAYLALYNLTVVDDGLTTIKLIRVSNRK
jgi:hypothetical protein